MIVRFGLPANPFRFVDNLLGTVLEAAGSLQFCRINSLSDWVSGAGELHPRALAEPDVNLSAHTAPIAEPRCARSCQ